MALLLDLLTKPIATLFATLLTLMLLAIPATVLAVVAIILRVSRVKKPTVALAAFSTR